MAERTPIIIAGLPGRMATEIALAVDKSPDLELHIAHLGSKHGYYPTTRGREYPIVAPGSHHTVLRDVPTDTLIVDFTKPEVAMTNARRYIGYERPFVMGTSGVNPESIAGMIEHSPISAVVDECMAPHLKVFGWMFKQASIEFPHALAGWVIETDRPEKPGKVVEDYWINNLRALTGYLRVVAPRDQYGHVRIDLIHPKPDAYISLESHLQTLAPFVDGTMMALRFLNDQVSNKGNVGRIFTMEDVLKGNNS